MIKFTYFLLFLDYFQTQLSLFIKDWDSSKSIRKITISNIKFSYKSITVKLENYVEKYQLLILLTLYDIQEMRTQ